MWPTVQNMALSSDVGGAQSDRILYSRCMRMI